MSNRLRAIFKKTLKLFLISLSLLLGLMVFAYFFLAGMLGLDQRIPALLAEKLGMECRVEAVHVILLPRPGLLLDNVLILSPGARLEDNQGLIGKADTASSFQASSAQQSTNATAQIEESRINAGQETASTSQDTLGAELAAPPSLPGENATLENFVTPPGWQTGSAAPQPFSGEAGTPVTHLNIQRLAIFLDIKQLIQGEIEPSGLTVYGLSLNLASLSDLSTISGDILARVRESTEENRPDPPSADGAPQITIINDDSTRTIVRVWEMLKSVSLNDTGVYLLNPDGSAEALFSDLNLREFLGTLTLSFILHGAVVDEPYDMSFNMDIGKFKPDNDSITFSLVMNADDGRGFSSEIATRVRYEQEAGQVFFDELLVKAGKTLLSSDMILTFEPENPDLNWQLKGPAVLKGFDLPRWVSPLTGMSPETQTLLSAIEGELELELNHRGLLLNNIKVYTGNYSWAGNGVLSIFQDRPHLGFYLKSNEMPLEAIFPLLIAPGRPPRFTDAPPGFDEPFFLSGDNANSPEVELVLEAETLLLRDLRVAGFKAVMHNRPEDVRWELSATDLAGGKLDAVILDNDNETIAASGTITNVRTEKLFPGMTWNLPINGIMDLNFDLNGPTDSPERFVQEMQLAFTASGKNVFLAAAGSPVPKLAKGERNFQLFDQLNLDARLQGSSLPEAGARALLTASGKITAGQQKDELSLNATGTFGLDADGNVSVEGLSLEGSVGSDLNFLGFSKRQSGKLTMKADYSQADDSFAIQVSQFSLAGMQAKASISGKRLGETPDISGEINLTTENLRKFLIGMGSDVSDIPPPLLGKASAHSRFSSVARQDGTNEIHFPDLSAEIDHMKLDGKAWFGPNSAIRADLSVNSVDLDAYFPDKDKKEPLPPARPWNVSARLSQNVSLNLTTPLLIFMKLPSENAKLRLTTGKGNLEANLSANLCGGAFDADLKGRDDAGVLQCSLSLRLEHADMEKITAARSGEIKAGGDLEVSLDIQGRAASFDDIPRGFDGQWAFNIGKGYFIRSQTQGPAGNREDGPMRSNFDFVKGAAEMKAGVLHTKDLLMDGPSTHMQGQGMVDLVKGQIAISMDLNMGGVAFPVQITGDLAAPQVNLHGGKFVTSNISNLGGGLIDLIGGVITLPLKIIELGTD